MREMGRKSDDEGKNFRGEEDVQAEERIFDHKDRTEYETAIQMKKNYSAIMIFIGMKGLFSMFVLNAPRYAREIKYHVKSEQGNGPKERVG